MDPTSTHDFVNLSLVHSPLYSHLLHCSRYVMLHSALQWPMMRLKLSEN